jgi:membrane protease YdiL (CAAX protease family)
MSELTRSSAPSPQSGQGRLVLLAVAFYSALGVAALVWGWAIGKPNLFGCLGRGSCNLSLSLGTGVALGLVTVGLSRLLERLAWARDLMRWFGEMLGPLRWRHAAALALLSAVGEEMFFRGALQQHLGITMATLAFALAHIPPRAKLWPWTLSAGVIGLLLALCARWTGHLLGPIVAHFLINLLNLRRACGHRE